MPDCSIRRGGGITHFAKLERIERTHKIKPFAPISPADYCSNVRDLLLDSHQQAQWAIVIVMDDPWSGGKQKNRTGIGATRQ